MLRIASMVLVTAAVLPGQEKRADSLEAPRQAAQKKAAEWEALANNLEPRVARMLPCDPRVQAAIAEVSRASEARLVALAQYLRAAAAKAKEDSDAANALAAKQEARAADVEAERTEAELERAGIDVQITGLTGATQRAALTGPVKTLSDIVALTGQRAALAQGEANRRSALAGQLKELVAASEARHTALQNETSALAAETARWSEYYTARLVRAQLECAITNQTPAPRLPQRKKK